MTIQVTKEMIRAGMGAVFDYDAKAISASEMLTIAFSSMLLVASSDQKAASDSPSSSPPAASTP